MVERVTTFSFHNQIVGDITSAQAELANFSQQITSGLKASTFSELGGDVVRLQDLEVTINSTSNFVNRNTTVLSRLQIMDVAVSELESVARDLASQLVLENSGAGPTTPLSELATVGLQKVADALNTQLAGRHLFSGSRTNTPAVDVDGLLVNSSVIDGVPTANYYDGNAEILSIRANKQLDVSYGITAEDQAFQDLIGALHKAIEGDDGLQLDIDQAVGLVNQAISGLADVRSRIGNDASTLKSANDQHGRVELQLKQALSEAIGSDLVELSIQIATNQTILTATMQSFARISSLSLVDFLR